MTAVTATAFPNLHAAFRAIEVDSGGHLIGTVYPGERIDLDCFEVPPAWDVALAPAEAALARLRARGEDLFETFVIGEQSEQEAIAERQGDLDGAFKLLNDFFDGWQPEDAPNAEATS